MKSEFSIGGSWNQPAGSLDEFRAWLSQIKSALGNRKPNLALVFVAPAFFDQAEALIQIIRHETGVAHLLGCSANSVIAGSQEVEEEAAFSLGLYCLPGAELAIIRFTQEQIEEWNGAGYWHLESGQTRESVNSWLVFADPFSLDAEKWLAQWNDAFPEVPVFGGLASGDYSARQIYETLRCECWIAQKGAHFERQARN